MSPNPRIWTAIKALRELGPTRLGWYAWYRLRLQTGALRRATPDVDLDAGQGATVSGLQPLLVLPSRARLLDQLGDDGLEVLLSEADEIVSGSVRIFGGDPLSLITRQTGQLPHWTDYELGRATYGNLDVKLIWEPGRFGWVYTLGRAYYLSAEERYASAFWLYVEDFFRANPPYRGPQWTSAQEAGLRLLALVFGGQIFGGSGHSKPERKAWLGRVLAAHAARIPPSAAYAQAQNNNHVLSEAAALYTAGMALPEHPEALRWRRLGWSWFQGGLRAQIAPDGAYMQHSCNYQRMILQLGLWMLVVARSEGRTLKDAAGSKLAAATGWLLELLDRESGRVPNLGPNDGAYILPLTNSPYHDYRPVLQAACLAFLGIRLFEKREWDEMSMWFALEPVSTELFDPKQAGGSPGVLRSPTGRSWAYLRAAHFSSRPGHADQLHLDLWWQGINLAQDAGTYLYNAPYPWENSLAQTGAHNTVMVNGQEQMTWVSRFLWLDWAQARLMERSHAGDGSEVCLVARHDGYRHLGVVHQRSVKVQNLDRWVVEDRVLPGRTAYASSERVYSACVHWLLPDWEWELEAQDRSVVLRIRSAPGQATGTEIVSLVVTTGTSNRKSVQLVRAGESLYGNGPETPTCGWVSPTYNLKEPALSFSIETEGRLPLLFRSEWILPGSES